MPIFLTAINDALKAAGVIAGPTQELTALNSQPQIQHQVDIVAQLWREALVHLFSHGSFAKHAATGEITLVAGQREYRLARDFESFIHEAALRGDYGPLFEYPGGYAQMLVDQTQYRWQGVPKRFALSPVAVASTRTSLAAAAVARGAPVARTSRKGMRFQLTAQPLAVVRRQARRRFAAADLTRVFVGTGFNGAYTRIVPLHAIGVPLHTAHLIRNPLRSAAAIARGIADYAKQPSTGPKFVTQTFYTQAFVYADATPEQAVETYTYLITDYPYEITMICDDWFHPIVTDAPAGGVGQPDYLDDDNGDWFIDDNGNPILTDVIYGFALMDDNGESLLDDNSNDIIVVDFDIFSVLGDDQDEPLADDASNQIGLL